MNKIFKGGVSAFYCRLYFCDMAIDPWPFLIFDSTDDDTRRGYILINKSIFCLSTSGNIEWRWLEIYLSDSLNEFPEYERLLGINISITSGQLGILDTMNREIYPIEVPNGDYIAYIFEFNRENDGNEDDVSGDFLTNDEILEQRTDLEHYKMVLVLGSIENEGVLKGNNYLY
jgi:hypothetical protein